MRLSWWCVQRKCILFPAVAVAPASNHREENFWFWIHIQQDVEADLIKKRKVSRYGDFYLVRAVMRPASRGAPSHKVALLFRSFLHFWPFSGPSLGFLTSLSTFNFFLFFLDLFARVLHYLPDWSRYHQVSSDILYCDYISKHQVCIIANLKEIPSIVKLYLTNWIHKKFHTNIHLIFLK